MNGPTRELMEAILAMWQKANETGEDEVQAFMATDGWVLLKVRPGGIRPNVSAMNSKGEDLFKSFQEPSDEPA